MAPITIPITNLVVETILQSLDQERRQSNQDGIDLMPLSPGELQQLFEGYKARHSGSKCAEKGNEESVRYLQRV